MTESASTSPSHAQQAQQSSPLREMRETQETPGAQENQPTQEPSAHQEEQPLAKPKITREEIAKHPLDKRAVITISAAFLITFAFDRLICSMPPTWLIGYELPVFWIICALTVTALHWKNRTKTSSCLACFGKHRRHWCVEYARSLDLVLFEKRRIRAHHAIRSTGVAYAALSAGQRALRCSPSTSSCLELVYRLVAAAVYSHSRFCGTVFRHIRKIRSRVETTLKSARNRHRAADFHSIAFDDHTVACWRRSNSPI